METEKLPHNQLIERDQSPTQEADADGIARMNDFLRELERRKIYAELGFAPPNDFVADKPGNVVIKSS